MPSFDQSNRVLIRQTSHDLPSALKCFENQALSKTDALIFQYQSPNRKFPDRRKAPPIRHWDDHHCIAVTTDKKCQKR